MDMDPGEYELLLQAIAEIHRQDVEEIEARRKGKLREGQPKSDAEIAFDLYTEELNATSSYLSDLSFARSLDSALETDVPLVQQLVRREIQELDDHEFAETITEDAQEQEPTTSPDSSDEESGHDRPQPLAAVHQPVFIGPSRVLERYARPAPSTHPSTSKAIPPPRAPVFAREPMTTCLICEDRTPVRTRTKVPCASKHDYCPTCITHLFHRSVLDETLFPPRCDGVTIPLDLVRHFFTADFLVTFAKKTREAGTRNRLYCHNPSCSQFLGEATVAPSAVPCSDCRRATCSACKGPAYSLYLPCAVDTSSQHVIELARTEGWQRCPSCHTMVELNTGCFHITCRCRAQFCYSCAAPWKTCECPQWDEARLLERAEQRVHNEFGNNEGEDEENRREGRVQAAVEQLRDNHECGHANWSFRSGGGACESCGDFYQWYLLLCDGCQMLACVPCQRNRL
ncbi:hypothetical protein BOTBODRAFT_480925 [Botryobasidium botryosum FD-172 SS1]|uniref:RBR-type E3 ubiquitin transferase n=1 Tax=Botryobasidium botryosum (strain FD-172 SS1) TaxID=930990 RepID=A0A067MTB8_BOTB1|nr:hypothetical protein BOTBODRAFT_480925 [Botryobasidium botryosum FD-172 SS1]